MKRGEKVAMGFVAVMVVAVTALTFYMESGRDEHTLTDPLTGGNLVDTAGLFPQGIDPSQLPEPESAGAKALSLYCVQCHDLPVPSMHTQDEWPHIIARMKQRMEMMGGVVVRVLRPSQADEQALTAYLQRHALQCIDTEMFSAALASPQGRLFQNTCSSCHAAPDPRQHNANEWARVVLRMKQNMEQAGRPLPPEHELQGITRFLQQQSTITG